MHLIQSFADRDSESLFKRVPVPRFRAFERVAIVRLAALHRARSLRDLAQPGLRLEALRGNRKGQHSIRINRQYRICFRWEDGDVFDVAITDYH
jgi:proteic killer suppression protein